MREPAGERQPTESPGLEGWLWIASIFTFAAVAAASAWMSGPIIHADEGGYLLNAAAIAGKFRTSVIWGSYYSGYSLFLTPAWWLLSDPRYIYHACLIINALLLATLPAALYWLLSALAPQSPPRTRLLASLAGAWQAPVLAMSQLTFSENALVPVYAWSLALLAHAALGRKTSLAAIAGGVSGYLFVIHPRGALLAGPAMAVMVVHALRNRFSIKWISALVVCGAAAAMLHWPLEWLAGKHGAAYGANYDPTRLSHDLLASFSWSRLGVDLLGVAAYTLVSSAAFVALGMLAYRTVAVRNRVANALVRGMAFALLACMAITAIFFMDGNRIDYVIYGRYVVPAMIPLIACGALTILARSRGAEWLAVGGTILLIVVLGWLFEHLPLPPRTPWMPENVIGLYPPLKWAKGVHWTVVGAYFLAFCCVIEIARLCSANTAIACFILVNLVIAGAFIALQLQPQSLRRDRERALVRAVAETESIHNRPLCVVLSPSVDHWHLVDYRFWLYRNVPESTTPRINCIQAEIAPITSGPPGKSWELAGETQRHSMGLFVNLSPGTAPKTGSASIIGAPLPGSH